MYIYSFYVAFIVSSGPLGLREAEPEEGLLGPEGGRGLRYEGGPWGQAGRAAGRPGGGGRVAGLAEGRRGRPGHVGNIFPSRFVFCRARP